MLRLQENTTKETKANKGKRTRISAREWAVIKSEWKSIDAEETSIPSRQKDRDRDREREQKSECPRH